MANERNNNTLTHSIVYTHSVIADPRSNKCGKRNIKLAVVARDSHGAAAPARGRVCIVPGTAEAVLSCLLVCEFLL